MKSKKSSFISNKIEKVMKEGVRRNTHAPVSGSNPRRKVSPEQAAAIAYSEYRRRSKGRKKSK